MCSIPDKALEIQTMEDMWSLSLETHPARETGLTRENGEQYTVDDWPPAVLSDMVINSSPSLVTVRQAWVQGLILAYKLSLWHVTWCFCNQFP